MPTIMTHAAVGLGLAAIVPLRSRPRFFWTMSALVPVVPDLDVLAGVFGAPWHSMWGHRGVTHSLAWAALTGVVVGMALGRGTPRPRGPLVACMTGLTASHGVLDAFTNGGPGIAFLAPFDDTRYFFPWRPLLVSPLPDRFFSEWGLRTLWSELRWIWLPLGSLMGAVHLWRRRRRPGTPGRKG
jgi:inner membrane protein